MTVKLQISGTKASIKIVTPIENRMNSMRPVSPQKGTKNPEHLQTNLPKSIIKKLVIPAKAD